MEIKEKLKAMKNKEFSASDNVKSFLEKIGSENKRYNIFLHVNKDAKEEAKAIDKKIKQGKAGKLAGLCIAVKSNINVKGMPISCASKTLKDYIGTYDADVIKKIKKEDGVIIGMTNMDEFASGISGETSYFGPTKNPACQEVVPGGSSSGSAAAVAAEMCDIALGSDTGGSVRNPASHCGVIGIKPSYGRVSRFGLIDLAMSFDQIGVLSKDSYGAALLMEVISGHSDKDGMTVSDKVQRYTQNKEKNDKELRFGLLADSEKLVEDKRIYELVKERASKVSKKLKYVRLKDLDLSIQTYYPIVYVEFFSGTRKFDGRKYGFKIEESCGTEVLRRILGGKEISRSEYDGAYYKKALAVKKLIQDEMKKAFKDVDAILLPVTPALPHKLGDNLLEDRPELGYKFDAFTTPANLSGICAAVVPAGDIDGIPVGIQIFAPRMREDILFKAIHKIEKIIKDIS